MCTPYSSANFCPVCYSYGLMIRLFFLFMLWFLLLEVFISVQLNSSMFPFMTAG